MTEDPPRASAPTVNRIAAGVLLAMAIVAPLLVWIYARTTPRLWGFPFFFWYQLLWVFIVALLTWCAYLLTERGNR